jgi:uncharacterized RDD family membrane protein YckC
MEDHKHALVLTGELLPGFDAATAWPALAAHFRIDPARLHGDVLARAPIAIKESDDLARLQAMQKAAATVGAASEIHALGIDGSFFVLLDNRPRGPLPHAFIEQRVHGGAWPADIQVAAVGSSDWRPFVVAPPSVAADAGAFRAAGSVPPTGNGSVPVIADGQVLPAGDAIHAGFWRRCAAYLIDSLILLIPSFILNSVPVLGLLTSLIGRWLYFALMESSPSQATLGKRAMGLNVTDGNGQRIGFGQATGRYFGGAISMILLYVGYMLAGWTARKQALHDLMADTCVVFETVKPGRALPTVRPPMPWYGWAANCLLLAIFPLAILAAIALPAYQDYVTRAKIIAVVNEAAPWQAEVAAAVAGGKPCPSDRRNSPNMFIGSIRFEGAAPDCSITLTFSSVAELPVAVRAESIVWTYSGSGEWTCTSSVANKYLPASCR